MNQWSSLHWAKKSSYKKQVEGLVWATCKQNKFQKFDVPVGITITGHFKSKRRRDIDNYSGGSTVKAILDGLVDAGIITDDNTKYVEHIKIRLEQDTVNKIRVIIGEINAKKTTMGA